MVCLVAGIENCLTQEKYFLKSFDRRSFKNLAKLTGLSRDHYSCKIRLFPVI